MTRTRLMSTGTPNEWVNSWTCVYRPPCLARTPELTFVEFVESEVYQAFTYPKRFSLYLGGKGRRLVAAVQGSAGGHQRPTARWRGTSGSRRVDVRGSSQHDSVEFQGFLRGDGK